MGGRCFLPLPLQPVAGEDESTASPSPESLEAVGDDMTGEARDTSGSLGEGRIKGELPIDGELPTDRFGEAEAEPLSSRFFLFLPSFLNQVAAFPLTFLSSSFTPSPSPINRSAL
jgi:hypothetical protein